MNRNKKELATADAKELFKVLQDRFEKNMNRHQNIEWVDVQQRLEAHPQKLWSLNEMELSGGAPDVIRHDQHTGEYIFYDCSAESPAGRRSVCYDDAALAARKEHKPADSALGMAAKMGVSLLNEEQYRALQKLGKVDTKTSSWLQTPENIRGLEGAIFGDFRYNTVFIYHNGVQSYYGSRGFRAALSI